MRYPLLNNLCFFDKYVDNEIFPASNSNADSGYSFENNPCLISLSQGHLPDWEYRNQIKRSYYYRLRQLQNLKMPLRATGSPFIPTFINPPFCYVKSHAENQNWNFYENLDHHFDINLMTAKNFASTVGSNCNKYFVTKNPYQGAVLEPSFFSDAPRSLVQDLKDKNPLIERYHDAPSNSPLKWDGSYNSS